MELNIQPKPEVEIRPADKAVVSKKEYFCKKTFEKINPYFFPAHFVRTWRPKAELIYPSVSDETTIQYECDFNRNVQNCFVEDFAEEVYLRCPPPCFVVLGKFGERISKLSQEIAKEYGSVLINVDNIINQVIQTNNETSKLLDRILRLGVSLTLNFILALLSFTAHTAEARHRGYVLCGLPMSPNSFDLSVEQQLNYLFTWENKPTVFINALYEDEDLVRARVNARFEMEWIGNEKRISLRTINDYQSESDTEEEEDELILPVKEEVEIDIPPSRPWVQLPRDEESQIWSELELFDIKIKPVIDLITSRVDPQYFITVDSRVKNEFELVQARLSLLQIWKSPRAFPFIPVKEKEIDKDFSEEEEEFEKMQLEDVITNEEDIEILNVSKEPPQIAFLTLFNKKTISPKYRWELSHYNYICPVALRNGQIVEGKSEFAVVFLKYIFFLQDEESMMKFLKNPRPYVLPVRPKPPARFFIVGFPYCGKTTLAKLLSSELSISLINAKTVLNSDLERKKYIYQEFCRQKAESRELLRLTVQAWQDWRMEEEQRITLIEEWIIYIQSLLNQRIQQFYSGEIDNEADKEIQVQSFSPVGSSETSEIYGEEGEAFLRDKRQSNLLDKKISEKRLQVQGVAVELGLLNPYEREHTPVDSHTTPSTKIIQAMKHEDYDFNENGLEVEANLFFSSLWSTFSNAKHSSDTEKTLKTEEAGEKEYLTEDSEEENIPVNWCNLLPPQSLSSMLLKKKPYTTRERRKSFMMLLTAASKAYWNPSSLKTEFVKWRLPCFMDIPLCEVYHDNPLLLFRYCPEWLKERPQIPDPVDPMHPSVLEAGRKAFLRADIVTVKHDRREIGILLRNAIEKAEKEGMRVTGEVISPGGWVVDDMVLDQDVWKMLAKENVVADHVYFLTDSDPEHRRIINFWYELHHQVNESLQYLSDSTSKESETSISRELLFKTINTEVQLKEIKSMTSSLMEYALTRKSKDFSFEESVGRMLRESARFVKQGEAELDNIFDLVNGSIDSKCLVNPYLVDPFCHSMLKDVIDNICDFREDSINEDINFGVQTIIDSSHYLFSCVNVSPSTHNLPLGEQFENFTNKIVDIFLKKFDKNDEKMQYAASFKEELLFFINLLMLPARLNELKNWLSFSDKGNNVTEIDVNKKAPDEVFSEVKKELWKHLIKKPRELEKFELDEIQRNFERDARAEKKKFKEEFENEGDEDETEEEDLRIYGESGPFCIVNLERNILLRGNPEIPLRYYGKLYFFWDDESKNKFIEDPEKYAPYYSPIRCLPPLRIYVVGPTGSGKSSLAKAISNQCSVHFVDYLSLLNAKLIPHVKPPRGKLTSLENRKLLLSEEHNEEAKSVKRRFMKAPYAKRQFWLENPFYFDVTNEKNQLLDNLIELNDEPLPTVFPELTYETIDLSDDEKLDSSFESDSIPKSNKNLQVFPYFSMKEIESFLVSYLQNKAGLNNYCLEKSLNKLWNEYPFTTQGFVLDGYPFRFFDIQSLLERKWVPDIVIELTLSEEEMIERNLKNKMQIWDTKLKQEILEEKLLEDTLNSIYRTLSFIRKSELKSERKILDILKSKSYMSQTKSLEFEQFEGEKEQEEVVAVSSKKLSGKRSSIRESIASAEITKSREPRFSSSKLEAEIDEIIQKEFPALEFNPIFETYDSAKERISADLVENYRRDSMEISKIKNFFQNISIPWVEISSLNDLQNISIDLFIQLNGIKKRINQKGEFAFELKIETAEKLLEQGFYFLSKFGRWCPVQVYRMKNPIHMYRPLQKKRKIFPIAYRNYIYFIGGENEKNYFLQDPIKYTFNEPHHPNIPLRVAVIGPPKSGKTTLSCRLGSMFGLKVLTMGSALRFVLENMQGTLLQKSIDEFLQRGCFLPLSLKIEALIASLNDPACVTQGFVFDGIPFDAAMAQSLAEEGKLPFVIISLVGDADSGSKNRRKLDLKNFRLPYKQRVNLNSRYNEWSETYKRFVQWNQDTYNNLYEVNAKSNVVEIFYEAYDIIRKSFFAILYYVEYCITDRALPLQYLCISQHEYELRKSCYYNNCPVCWEELGRLNSASDPPPRSGLVQYLNHFYWICQEHMEKFIKSPKKFLPPNVPKFPTVLPKILNRKMFESASSQMKIHGYGRCPVIRIDFPSSLDWEGSWDFAALYGEKVYLCKNEKMLNRFMSKPWRYANADTTFEVNRLQKSKAVEQLGPPMLTSLPPIGFLEQTVSDLIHESLQVLGAVRPVFPNLTPSCTGCIFVALYLKVHNKNNKFSYLEKEYFEFMMQNCKAYSFKVLPFRSTKTEEGQGDFAVVSTESNDSESSEEESHAFTLRSAQKQSEYEDPNNSCWMDFDSQADKKMWSAKYQNPKICKMRLTKDGELQEIQELPKFNVVLRYQTYSLRSNPLPPIPNCLTFIYSCKPNIELPEKFNVNTLYQPAILYSSPFPLELPFNPEKENPAMLYSEAKPKYSSDSNLWKGKRTISDSLLEESKPFVEKEMDPDLEYMIKHFIPRFQLLDVIYPVEIPAIPKVIETDPVIFNPHRDYSYTMLMSDFFKMSHVLKCYEWNQSVQQFEFTNKLDRNLGLCNVRSQFFFKPEISPSMKTMRSMSNFIDTTFYAWGEAPKPEESSESLESPSSPSDINFIQMIILEKIDEIFTRLSVSDLSYDSYEVHISSTDSDTETDLKPEILIREILPYPPLIWDIASRPYYAYRSLPSLFEVPHLDHIAHERHVSLLDGIIEPNDHFRFVRYPTWVQTKHLSEDKISVRSKRSGKCKEAVGIASIFFVYEFFDLPWTSFLTYPFSWAYNLDIKDNFRDFDNSPELDSREEESHETLL